MPYLFRRGDTTVKQRREDGGCRAERRATQSALWMKGLLSVPALNSKVRLSFFFHANKGQRDSDHSPLLSNYFQLFCFLVTTWYINQYSFYTPVGCNIRYYV